MQMINEIEKLYGEMTAWRKEIHKYPELKFEEFRTSELVSTKLNELRNEIEKIENCELKKNASKIVFSDGNNRSKVMIVGEGPGE